jgi:flavin-dependent thymidylate synthase
MKQVKVTLINCTPEPEKTIFAAWQIMHREPVTPENIFVDDKAPDDKIYSPVYEKKIMLHSETMKDVLFAIGNQVHQGVLEMVHFNFLIENVSRAFQQQLTRTRQASYCIQSLRIVRCDNFADEGSYLRFNGGKGGPGESLYIKAMEHIQNAYRSLVRSGVSAEEARGILPLAIHSPIWMGINLRSLIHMLDQRFCVRTQGEFQKVAEAIREAVREVHPMLAEAFLDRCGCNRTETCSNSSPCGKYPKLGGTKKFKVETDEHGKTTTHWE